MKNLIRGIFSVILVSCMLFSAVPLSNVNAEPTPTPQAGDIQYNWRIVGQGEQSFTTPGMKGTSTMIVKLNLTKQGGATPAGTYTGSLYVWYNEMTPELMAEYGITGDSYNEYATDSFTVEVIPQAGSKEWPYQAERTAVGITVTSITDVVAWGHKQQVTDYPSVLFGHSFEIDPDSGSVRMVMTLGRQKPLEFDNFQLEMDDYSLLPLATPTPAP